MSLSLYSKIEGQGNPIILLHGLFGASDNLGRLSAQLSPQNEVHSLDLCNHGSSPHSNTMNYDSMAEDVYAYIDKQDLARVNILGHSMGGKVAMKFALEYPERVNKLVIVDIAPVDYPAHHDQIFEGLFAINVQTIKSRSEADEILSGYIPEKGVRQFLIKNLKREGNDHFVWKINLHGIYQNYQNISAGLAAKDPFKGDVLFIAGGLSDYLKPNDKKVILNLFPAASVKIIPGASHWLHAEKPVLFNSICERFLKD